MMALRESAALRLRCARASRRWTVAHGMDELEPLEGAITALAERSAIRNVFAEPLTLFPYMRHLDDGETMFLCIWRRGVLIGFTPVRQDLWREDWSVQALTTQLGDLFPRGAPLIDRDHAEEAWAGLFAWFGSDEATASLMQFDRMRLPERDLEPLEAALRGVRGVFHRVTAQDTAMLALREDSESALEAAMSAKTRSKMRRSWRQLEKLGGLDLVEAAAEDAIDAHIDAFLALEDSGWKGRGGTSLAASAEQTAFFRETLRAAHAQGRLALRFLTLEGRPIAAHVELHAGAVGFCYKTAYDERHAAASPGVLLEIEAVKRRHERRAADPQAPTVFDSCSFAEIGPAFRTWPDRSPVQQLQVGRGLVMGLGVTALAPATRRLASQAHQALASARSMRAPRLRPKAVLPKFTSF